MSTLSTTIKVQGLVPGLNGTAAAEATSTDVGPGEVREVFNAGPDPLHVYPIIVTDDGHKFGKPATVEPGNRHTITRHSKLGSSGEANVVLSGTVKR